MEGREYEKEVPQKRKKVQKIASLNDAEEQRIENQVADSCAAKAKKSKKTKKSEEVSDWVRVTTNTQSQSSQISQFPSQNQADKSKKTGSCKQFEPSKQAVQKKACKKRQQEAICGLCFELYLEKDAKQHKEQCPAILKYCFDCGDNYPSSIFEMHREVCEVALKKKQEKKKLAEEQEKQIELRMDALRRMAEMPAGSPQAYRRINMPGMMNIPMPSRDMFRAASDGGFPPFHLMAGMPPIFSLPGSVRQQMMSPPALPCPIVIPQTSKSNQTQISKQRIAKIDKLHQVCYIPQDFESEDCSICCVRFLLMQQLLQLKCKHVYHMKCIIQWLKKSDKCPLCIAAAL